ncbi:MAG: hypothetical protein KDA21_02100 [Phycisphaerales bacterium]|nr:hypothetical protein [Phycisphaerales bacterium]
MIQSRGSILVGRLAFGTLWAGLLTVLGVLILLDAAAPVQAWLGITAIAAGQLVFMYAVADRVCRFRDRTIINALEMVVVAITLVGFLGVILHFDAAKLLSLAGVFR